MWQCRGDLSSPSVTMGHPYLAFSPFSPLGILRSKVWKPILFRGFNYQLRVSYISHFPLSLSFSHTRSHLYGIDTVQDHTSQCCF